MIDQIEPCIKPCIKPCTLCPRLVSYRHEMQEKYPSFHNAPVADFGTVEAEFLIVGLAPGLHGANRTGVPFTGDGAGKILYKALLEKGFACGTYREEADNGLQLLNCRITNAVHCLPPQNKPNSLEIRTCRTYLHTLLTKMKRLRVILCLGRIAHESVMKCLGEKCSFGHHHIHTIGDRYRVFDSYHCSRYNVATKRLTYDMFVAVIGDIRKMLTP